MKYKTKPVEIEAIQWNGRNREEIFTFVGKELEVNLESETAYVAGQGAPIFSLTIPTLEGDHKAMQGDYIIRGLKGEYYPCKPDIFEMKYETTTLETHIIKELGSHHGSHEGARIYAITTIHSGKTEVVVEKTISERLPIQELATARNHYERLTCGNGRLVYTIEDLINERV